MKRLALLVATLMLALTASAQQKGVVAGFTASNTSLRHLERDVFDSDAVGHFHLGLTYNLPLFAGISLQPEILYNRKGTIMTKIADDPSKVTMSYLELGVQAQLDILPSRGRIYGFVEPYVGYCLTDKFKQMDFRAHNRWYYLNKLEGGFALGAGIQLFDDLQLSGKVFWNLGTLYDAEGHMDFNDAKAHVVTGITQLFKGGNSFNGLSLSLVYFFD